jgi:hypothetical protein
MKIIGSRAVVVGDAIHYDHLIQESNGRRYWLKAPIVELYKRAEKNNSQKKEKQK